MPIKILFVLNPGSGTNDTTNESLIEAFFNDKNEFLVSFWELDFSQDVCSVLHNKLEAEKFDIVVASGGDGTVKLVAETIYGTNIKLGILPMGSANGLANNLSIPVQTNQALQVIAQGKSKAMSSLTINDNFCIHLADIGLNASIVKQFEKEKRRGFLGYANAFKNVIFKQKRVRGKITLDEEKVLHSLFFMLAFCNATGYGTGLEINPEGKLDDDKFEIVEVKKLSFWEGMKLYVSKNKPLPEYAAISSCKRVHVQLSRAVHLQVDGEYLGKVKEVNCHLNEKFIEVLC